MTTTDSVRTAYASQMSRDFHGITRGIATTEKRRGWEADFDHWLADHEAEVVGRILDRIDALHQSEDVPTSQHYYCEPYECDRAGEGGMEPICTECRIDFPCPTRRLTAEIRGGLNHG